MRCIIISLIFLISLNCSNEPASGGHRFKENVTRLVNILRENSELVKASEKSVTDNVKILEYDRSESKKFLRKHKAELINIDNALAKISEEESNSNKMWFDDAALCRAIQYNYLFGPNNEIFNKTNSELWEIIVNYEKIEIEPWTKDALGEYYSMFFRSLPENLKSGLTDTDVIKGGLASLIISELCVHEKYNEADKELSKLKDRGINILFIKNIDAMIKRYRRIKNLNEGPTQ